MSQKLFQTACEALWGHHYRVPGAEALGIGLRSMMRYDAGDRPVPPIVMARLGKLLAQRQAAIVKLQPRVEAAGQMEAA